MKWGLCQVHCQWYEASGSQREWRYWFDGQNWVQTPVEVGPFNSEEEALAYKEANKLKSCFAYYENDPYGRQGT